MKVQMKVLLMRLLSFYIKGVHKERQPIGECVFICKLQKLLNVLAGHDLTGRRHAGSVAVPLMR